MKSLFPNHAVAIGALLFALTASAIAQTYPTRPIRLIAPFPAGGLADVLARLVSDEMSKSLGQPIIVENRAGAGATLVPRPSPRPRPMATRC